MGGEGERRYALRLIGLAAVGLAWPLQQALVFPALPSLARDLETTRGWATWILTIFLLVCAVTAPLAGRLGDQFGKKRLLVGSVTVAFFASLGAMLSQDIWTLIVFRALTGLGGACPALCMAIVRDQFPRAKRSQIMGLISGLFGLGGAIGVTISGFVIEGLSWRWLFAFGAIALGVAIVLAVRFVPESTERAPMRLDVPGAVLFGAGVLCLLLALTEVQRWGAGSPQILGLFAATVVLLLSWGWVELRAAAPMIDLRLFGARTLMLTNGVTLLSGFALIGTFVLVPVFVQAGTADYGFGASPTRAGLFLTPAVVVQVISGPLAGVLGARIGSKWPLVFGVAMQAAGAAALARWHDTPAAVICGLLVLGTGFGAVAAATPRLIADAVGPTQTAVATGMNSLLLSLGGVLGATLVAVLLGAGVAAESAFVHAFWASALVAFGGALLALLITRKRRPAALPVEQHAAAD